jgi:hypothetical protein
MLFKMSWLRLACVACVLAVIGWAAGAAAQTKVKYSLSGTGGFWIGGGMLVPITKGVKPNAAMVARPGATVQQTQTASPHQMTICPWQMEGGAALGGGTVATWAPQALNNPKLFQISTLLTLKFPAEPGRGINVPNADGNVVFKANGRTGPPTLTWCPGNPATNPPTCTASQTYKGVSGQMTYRKLVNQFGGPGQGQVGPLVSGVQQGRATLWGKAASYAPCKHTAFGGSNPGCFAAKGYATPAPLVGAGAPFGYYYKSTPATPVGNNLHVAWILTGGTIVGKVPAAVASFNNNPKGFGGPWTTGQLTIIQPKAVPPETFTLTGSDGRAPTGVGNISLVSGGLSNRAKSGPNANSGWLNLIVGPVFSPVPSLSGWSFASLGFVLLGIGAAGLALARRRK